MGVLPGCRAAGRGGQGQAARPWSPDIYIPTTFQQSNRKIFPPIFQQSNRKIFHGQAVGLNI